MLWSGPDPDPATFPTLQPCPRAPDPQPLNFLPPPNIVNSARISRLGIARIATLATIATSLES